MFDKLYKEANDEIPVNTALKESLLCKASDKSYKKTIKFKSVIHKAGFAAAAAAVIALSFNVMPYIQNGLDDKSSYIDTGNNPKPADGNENYTVETPKSSEKPIASNEPKVSESSQHPADTPKPEKSKNQKNADKSQSAVAPKSDNISDKSDARKEDVPAKTSVNIEGSADSNAKTAMPKSDVPSDAAKESNSPESHSGGSSASGGAAIPENSTDSAVPYSKDGIMAVKALPNESGSETNVTLDEYCDYHGFNLNGIVLPSEMTRTGNYEMQTDQIQTITYSGGGKSAAITLVPDPLDIPTPNGIRHGNAIISGNDDDGYTIYIKNTNNGLIISTNGLSEKEAYTLADSVK